MSSHRYEGIVAKDHAIVRLGDTHYHGERERLRFVEGATFDAEGQAHTTCHPETRKEVLRDIKEWTQLQDAKPIFWLNGMAGTGKSTIACTIADWLSQQDVSSHQTLGASFFFKRGERDRASATLFFPTIIRQLCRKIQGLGVLVDKAIDDDPDICSKALGQQFEKLMKKPLLELNNKPSCPAKVVTIVVDALDECHNIDQIRILLDLWSHLPNTNVTRLRWFLTSRPELPLRLGFAKMSSDAYRDIILHEVPPPTIEHDILVFLKDKFASVREEYNIEPLSGTLLSEAWPGEEVLQELTNMAVPLFIIAATICRFVQDQDCDAQEQLEVIRKSRKLQSSSQISQTYLPILQRMVSSEDATIRKQLYHEFRLIVGAIITLAEPLSRSGLSMLLGVPPAKINLRLRPLHSVLQVPVNEHSSIRPLHLFFGEFLNSNELQNQPFHVEPATTHAILLTKCIELLSQPHPTGLCENMCQLDFPGYAKSDINPEIIRKRLSPAVRYACRYWTYHAQCSERQILDNGEVHVFLKLHFLHWLESLSLLNDLYSATTYLNMLQSNLVLTSVDVTAFLKDAHRFILTNRHIINTAPLQAYSSAIVFAPQKSIVRTVCGHVPEWIQQCPTTPSSWGSVLQKLEGHTNSINDIAFSPDGSTIVSASNDGTVRLWDPGTGQEIMRLEGHTSSVMSVAFFPDGSYLASSSRDDTVRLWDYKTGRQMYELSTSLSIEARLVFSPDSTFLAFRFGAADHSVHLWDLTTNESQLLEGWEKIEMMAFSPDNMLVVVGWIVEGSRERQRRLCRVWNTRTRQMLQTPWMDLLHQVLAFSPVGSLLVTAATEGPRITALQLLNTITGLPVQMLELSDQRADGVAFSNDGSLIVSFSYVGKIHVWRLQYPHWVQLFSMVDVSTSVIALSPNGSLLAFEGSKSIWLWDLTTKTQAKDSKNHFRSIENVGFSTDGSLLVAYSFFEASLWDAKQGSLLRRIKHLGPIMVSSPDCAFIASVSQGNSLVLWNMQNGQMVKTLEKGDDLGPIHSVKFSPDGSLLTLLSEKGAWLWDLKSYERVLSIEGRIEKDSLSFSEDGTLLAHSLGNHGHQEKDFIQLWNPRTGKRLQQLKLLGPTVYTLTLSPDSCRLALSLSDRTIQIWSVRPNQELSLISKFDGGLGWYSAMAFSPDGSFLAALSHHAAEIWDLRTATQISARVGLEIVYTAKREVKFAADTDGLVTDAGLIGFDTTCVCFIKDDWIEIRGKKTLWLPVEYRNCPTTFKDGRFAIRLQSDRVVFLKLRY